MLNVDKFITAIADACNRRYNYSTGNCYKNPINPGKRYIQLSFNQLTDKSPWADIYDPKNDRLFILQYCGIACKFYLQENFDNGDIKDWKVSKTLTPCVRELKKQLYGETEENAGKSV